MLRQGKNRFQRVLAAAIIGCAVATAVHAQAPAKPASQAAKTGLPAAPRAGTYKIDLDHSHAHFVVSHLGISRFIGRFDVIQGDYVVGDRPEKSSVKASIRVDSINAKHQKLEEHLRSADFFDAARFPSMDFVSTKVNWNNRGEGVLSGNLTIHGVTRPVDFALKATGAGAGLRGETRSGFEAKTTIKRSDFGMQYGLPTVVGDDVEIALSVEGILQ
jgi:polyisoprenoid-binding protein YceI